MAKLRKFKVQKVGSLTSDINVTPLVDVVLVLLIIFMVVTPLLEKDIEVRVPSTEQVEEISEVPADQLVVALDAQGELSINAEKIADDEYVNRLKRVLAAKAAGDRLVFFMAEEKTSYAKLIAALDGARRAGAETLGMMTETAPLPPPGAPPSPDGPPAPDAPGAPPAPPVPAP